MGTREILIQKSQYITGRVLDLGAGQGKYKSFIESRASEYKSFDVEDAPNIDVVGDIHNLPFENSSFDTVICTQVFEHIQMPWVVAKEIQRVLKPGGYAIVTAPFMIPYHAHPYDFYRYTTEGMSFLFKDLLEIVEIESYGKTFTVIAELLRFEWLSPYEKHGRIKKYFFEKIIKVLLRFDKFSKSKSTYSNVVLIAKK